MFATYFHHVNVILFDVSDCLYGFLKMRVQVSLYPYDCDSFKKKKPVPLSQLCYVACTAFKGKNQYNEYYPITEVFLLEFVVSE